MLTVICGTEEEVVAVRMAWAESRLDEVLGGYPFAVWLGETFRFGSDGTDAALPAPSGRHRAGATPKPQPRPRRAAGGGSRRSASEAAPAT